MPEDNQENLAVNPAATEDDSANPGQQPDVEVNGDTGTPPADQQQEAAPATNEPAKTPEWVQRRIDQLTAQKHQTARERDELALRLAQLEAERQQPNDGEQQQQAQPRQAAPTIDPAAMRQQIAKEMAFNAACDTTYQNGVKDFPDFDAALSNFNMLGGLQTEFLELVNELPNGHAVLYELGKNPDEASRILTLPPVKQAMALAQASAKAGQPKKTPVSAAPAPIKPSDGNGRVETDPEKMTMDEWMKWRNSQARN